MRITYEHELEELNKCLRDMAMMVEKAIEQTFVAFEDQNYTMAEDVIKGDRNVNDMERAIESRCLSLILRQQPVAKDLRQISTALKVVTDLERIGDHASDIAELILRIKSDHAYHIVQHLPAMAASAQKMVHDAVEAFIKQDVEEAEEIIRRDDEVDALFNQVKTDVVELLKSSPSHADQGIDLLMIASMDRLSYDKEEVKAFLAEMDLNGISIFNVGSNTVTLASGWDLMAFIRQMISPENGGDAQ